MRARRVVLEREREAAIERLMASLSARKQLADVADWSREVCERSREFSYEEKRTVLRVLGVSAKLYRSDHQPRVLITSDVERTPATDDNVSEVRGA